MSLEADNVYDRKPNELIMFTACRLSRRRAYCEGLGYIAPLMRNIRTLNGILAETEMNVKIEN